MGFQVASDAFAYVYVTGLLKALDVIEQDMNDGVNILDRWFEPHHDRRLLGESSSRQQQQYRPHRQLHLPPTLETLPEPLFCNNIYCSTPHPPSCLNYELPTFGNPGITVKSQGDWAISHNENKWNYEVGKVDIKWIKESNESEEWKVKCKHAGMSALVLFCYMISCVQYEVSVFGCSFELGLPWFDCFCKPGILTDVTISSLYLLNVNF